ncbi:aminodeoxychorismate synthase, component I [Clostridium thermobutyricum]|uniref:Anthranilate synthase component 1 n=1 Tax=Clostridium thermobutyricum TaxID=29372 RepID=N9XUH8_9CLOT|nr:aminodeoxychorismate synthase component I [Clostridium thermobutyricum]ENZ03363.1 aminodeoxychorismate synthase, component I [Clostridium thermobutyricum]
MKIKIKELDKCLSSIEVFEKLKEEGAIFLDSSKKDEKLSKYSFIGLNIIEKFEVRGETSYINDDKIAEKNPFEELEKRIKIHKIDIKSDIPLIGGYIGYISYDTGRILEKIIDKSTQDIDIPNMRFYLYENIVVFDHLNEKMFITAIGENENRIDKSLIDLEEKIFKSIKLENYKSTKESIEFKSNFTKESYIETVKKMRDYIREGDIYIANMTQRYISNCNKDGFSIYKNLRSINGAPFSTYVNYGDFEIISSSPERFIQVKEGLVHTRPIKGTRPRGKNKEEDDFYRNELINSEKDKSELLMIVDLERNDLSKVCEKGSVNVTELFKIEEYETVFHLVSTIEGRLKEGVSSVRCIQECFPGGSITGAPKIRAMEVIEELEGLKRNLYTGSIGYFDLRGNSDFNIVIRTIVKKDDIAYFGVGGGVTYESLEEDEYYETLQKAKALMEALR